MASTSKAEADLLESGAPVDDSRAFRRALGQYPTGVTVVTAMDDGQPIGMAVNSFAAVSLEPALILWSIRRQSAAAQAYSQASHFAVNILAADQLEISRLFGAPNPDRFGQINWSPGEYGSPLIAGAIAQLQCRLDVVHDGGDHLILIGHVDHYARFAGEPLVFSQGQYAVTHDYPAEELADQSPTASSYDSSFLRLLNSADQHLSSRFQAERDQLGVSVSAARILSRLREAPLDHDTLQQETFLGAETVEDTLTDLTHRGLTGPDEQGRLALTKSGQQQAELLSERAAAFTARSLGNISETDVATTTRVLQSLIQHR